MPSPTTTDLPRPRSWDEFEDICADVLKRVWKDPYVVRHGRSGQRQHGVDIFGCPGHLGSPGPRQYAGAQCKETDELTITTVDVEVAKAVAFEPTLTEYVVMTTSFRNAQLQNEIRAKSWPFDVHIMFWDDISLDLSGHDDLLQKYFSGWMHRTTTKANVISMLLSSAPEDFDYYDRIGVYVHTRDVLLRLVLERGPESEERFHEPWASNFPDPTATRQPVYIHYAGTSVLEVPCAYVDGGRHVIPFPRSATDLTLTPLQYHLGRVLNHPIPGYGFDVALHRAGITVSSDDST